MDDNKIRLTSDKIVESPSDRKREVKSQESDENDSKSWIEKVRQYIGPAFAALTMGGLAVQGILAISGVGGSTPETSGTALALRGSDDAMRPPALPELRAEFIGKSSTEPYVPAPQPEWLSPPKGPTVQEIWPGLYEEMVKGLEEKGQASKNSLQEEAQETYNGETSSEQAKPDKNKSRKLLSSREEKIATMRASIDKLKENSEAVQILEKMLNEKKRSLSEIPAARTHLSDKQSTCHDPCSDIPASVDCIKECTTDEIAVYKNENAPTCLDVSTSGVSARIEPTSSLVGSGQQVFLDYNYNLRVQNNCPHPISNIEFQIDISTVCPSGTTGSTVDRAAGSIANRSSIAPGEFAGVAAGQTPSGNPWYCTTYDPWHTSPESYSLPLELSAIVSASGVDAITNTDVSSRGKKFIVLGSSIDGGIRPCDLKCSPGHKGPNRGAIAGGVIGGVSALALAWYFCCSSRSRERQPRAVEPSSRPNDVHPRHVEPSSRPNDVHPRHVEPSSRPNDVRPRAAEPPSCIGHDSLPNPRMPSERMGFR